MNVSLYSRTIRRKNGSDKKVESPFRNVEGIVDQRNVTGSRRYDSLPRCKKKAIAAETFSFRLARFYDNVIKHVEA